MSDADDQMGGQGGESGRARGEGGAARPPEHGKDSAGSEETEEEKSRSGRVDDYGEDSFPASDPPGTP